MTGARMEFILKDKALQKRSPHTWGWVLWLDQDIHEVAQPLIASNRGHYRRKGSKALRAVSASDGKINH